MVTEMKRIVSVILCLSIILSSLCQMVIAKELTDVNKYGMEITYRESDEYVGNIELGGMYVYKTSTDYVFTLKYDAGTIKTYEIDNKTVPVISFFEPPNGDTIMVSWLDEKERLTLTEDTMQIVADRTKVDLARELSMKIFDPELDLIDDDFTTTYFRTSDVDWSKVPTESEMIEGYGFESEESVSKIDDSMSSWSKKALDELALYDLLKEDVFANYDKTITRLEFMYLVVKAYESMTGESVVIDESISFMDTTDEYALKAATIGISNGIGENKFGPDIPLNREQMAVILDGTLLRAVAADAIDAEAYDDSKNPDAFADGDMISSWAIEGVYETVGNGILNGVGDNNFNPKGVLTNEQALYAIYNVLSKYGNLNFYSEVDGSRLYLKSNDKLYQIPMEENILIKNDKNGMLVGLKSFDDLNTFTNIAKMKPYQLKYDKLDNPNIEGILLSNDLKAMSVDVQTLYTGVDKSGEKTTITFDMNGKKSTVSIQTKIGSNTIYNGLDRIHYYDMDGAMNEMSIIPLDVLAVDHDLSMTVEYNADWDIYTIAFE